MLPSGHGGAHAHVRFEQSVEAYFTACFGSHRLAAMSGALARPSLTPTLRVNTIRMQPQDAAQTLQQELREQQLRELGRGGPCCVGGRYPSVLADFTAAEAGCGTSPFVEAPQASVPSPLSSPPAVRLHPRISTALVLQGRGPCQVDYDPEQLPEVVVNRFAGEAALKGAHVFVPGVLAAAPGIAAGDLVAVSTALERPVGLFGRERTECDDNDEAREDDSAGPRAGPAARMSVGISRGATVDPHGAVPLAWASQTGPKRRLLQRLHQQPAEQGQQQQPPQPPRPLQSSAGTLISCDSHHGDAPEPENRRGGEMTAETKGSSRCSSDCEVGDSNDGGRKSSSSSGRSGSGRRDSSFSSSSGWGTHSLRSERVFLGIARAVLGRRAMFRNHEGLALVMEKRVFEVPACNGLLRGQVMLQALPSIVAAQALNPRPGSRVLDMCAAPGGKTTALAALMENTGRVVALDRTAAKVAEIMSLAEDLGATCVEAYTADATEAVSTKVAAAASPPVSESPAVGRPPYPPSSFDYVLLDPPCSALGLRPRLLHPWSLKQMRSMAAYQRSLFHTAVQLLAPGGEMVYCTCTINPDENEANVAWALDRFSGSLELLPADPLIGLPGLVGADPETGARWLTEREASMVQRFDPGPLLPGRQMAPHEGSGGEGVAQGAPHPAATRDGDAGLVGEGSGQLAEPRVRSLGSVVRSRLAYVDDVMGFFIARFRKRT